MLTSFAKPCIALAVTGVAAVSVSAPAAAGPQDAAFLQRLNSVGITSSSPLSTFVYAQKVCRELSFGTPHARVAEFVDIDSPYFNSADATNFVVMAYMTYCPAMA